MTTATGPLPRVWVETADSGLGDAIRLAVGLLADVGRIRIADSVRQADIVHTVGDATAVGDNARRVHTVDRVPLREGRLVAVRSWVRQQRRRRAQDSAILVHGRTAARLVVSARLSPGERVHCVPVLSPLHSRILDTSGSPARAEIRAGLHLPPGVQLVIGTSHDDCDWSTAVQRLHRQDVIVVQLHDQNPAHVRYPDSAPADRAARMSLADLLSAADLFVATGPDLMACNPGAAALAMRVPVVAVTTDSAADLVIPGRSGCVVPSNPTAVANAVRAHLDGAQRRRSTGGTEHSRRELGHLARGLLRVYEQAPTLPLGNRKGAGRR
jgi:hypothetical protein